LSADLSGGSAQQEGFASLVANGGTLAFNILTNGIGTPTRAAIRRAGADVVDLGADFTFGVASGSVTSGQVAAILNNPGSHTLLVEGPDGSLSGPLTQVAATAAGVNADPLRRNFGDVAVGTRTDPRSVTVSNTADTSFRITAVGIFGADKQQYSLVDDSCAGKTLQSGQSCTFSVRFEPAATGTIRALGVVRSTDPDHPEIRVQLRGNGV